MNIAQVGIKGALRPAKDGFGRIGERLVATLAVEPLMAGAGTPVLLDINVATMNTANFPVREAVLGQESLYCLGINDFGQFRREAEHTEKRRFLLRG